MLQLAEQHRHSFTHSPTHTVLHSAEQHRHSLTHQLSPCYVQRNSTATHSLTHSHLATFSGTAPPLTHSHRATFSGTAPPLTHSHRATFSEIVPPLTHAKLGNYYQLQLTKAEWRPPVYDPLETPMSLVTLEATPVSIIKTLVCWHKKLLISVSFSICNHCSPKHHSQHGVSKGNKLFYVRFKLNLC